MAGLASPTHRSRLEKREPKRLPYLRRTQRSDAGRWGEQARAQQSVAAKRDIRQKAAARLGGKEAPTLEQLTKYDPEEAQRFREANLKSMGIPLTKMNSEDAKNWVGYTGQKTIKVYRGVSTGNQILPGDYVTTSKESAQNYGKNVVEMDVPASHLRYVRGHIQGDPKLLDIGGQTELIYAPPTKRVIDRKAATRLGKKGTP